MLRNKINKGTILYCRSLKENTKEKLKTEYSVFDIGFYAGVEMVLSVLEERELEPLDLSEICEKGGDKENKEIKAESSGRTIIKGVRICQSGN